MDQSNKTIHFTGYNQKYHDMNVACTIPRDSVCTMSVVMRMSPLGRVNCFYITRFLLGCLAVIQATARALRVSQ